MQKSSLVQVRIGSPSDAATAFNSGRNGQIVLVCVPSAAKIGQFFYSIPSGYHILYQEWGAHKGDLEPGLKMWWPAWFHITHIVTKGTLTYNAPTRQCPTADNIMVNVDLSLTFSIGPDAESVKDFCYLLGPARMDEYMSSQTEEAIRGLVFSVTHDQVNDLREEFAQGVLGTLQSKMKKYGIEVKTAKITDVQLPQALMARLENTTSFKTKIQEQRKRHENTIRVIKDGAQQEIEQLVKNNARLKQDITAQIQRFETERKELSAEVVGQNTVMVLDSQNDKDVAISKSKGDLQASRSKAQKDGEELRRHTRIKCDQRVVEAQNKSSVMILDSESELLDAEKKAESIVITATAEDKSSKFLVEQRKYELEKEKMSVMKSIAGNGRKFLSGKEGSDLFDQLIPAN
jgi:hypothetical protein